MFVNFLIHKNWQNLFHFFLRHTIKLIISLLFFIKRNLILYVNGLKLKTF